VTYLHRYRKKGFLKKIRGKGKAFSKSLFLRGVRKVILKHPKIRGKRKVKTIIIYYIILEK